LAAAGADEFYCGVVPEDWVERFGTSGVSRRIFANLSSYAELERVVVRAKELHTSLSLALNAQHYDEDQLSALLSLAERFARMGGEGVIVGDVSFLSTIADAGFGFDVCISSILSCRNSEAARFYRDLGASRVIFPREVTLVEMAQIVSTVPSLEYEAFVLNDGCVFEEGVCHTIHLPGRLGGPICLDDYRSRYQRADGRELGMREAATLEANEENYRFWLWCRFGCGFSVTEAGYPFGPCGLCAMPAMEALGLTAIKIAGREAATERKVRSVEMVAAVRNRMKEASENADVAAFARGIRNRQDLCDTGYMCYYREILEDRESDIRTTP
jgi:putative protease